MSVYSKYHAHPVSIDNIRFDSKAESRRYLELKTLQQAGEISGLEIHPCYPLEVCGHKIGRYEADFSYIINGRLVVEDVKGVKTDVYRLKKKLMLALHNIEILETKAK
jgi:hypothetical protein